MKKGPGLWSLPQSSRFKNAKQYAHAVEQNVSSPRRRSRDFDDDFDDDNIDEPGTSLGLGWKQAAGPVSTSFKCFQNVLSRHSDHFFHFAFSFYF